jgi:hypothetical protein
VRVCERRVRVRVRVVPEWAVSAERSGLGRMVEATGGAPRAARRRRHRRAHCIPLLRGARSRRARHHYAQEVRSHLILAFFTCITVSAFISVGVADMHLVSFAQSHQNPLSLSL